MLEIVIVDFQVKDPREDSCWPLVMGGGAMLLDPRSFGVPPHLSCP